jgi:hypothetical protein
MGALGLCLGCYDWGMQIRSVVTFILILFITLLGSGVDAIIAQVQPDVRKCTLNGRRTAKIVEQLGIITSPRPFKNWSSRLPFSAFDTLVINFYIS